jgi:hypothetical protein
VVHVVLMRRSDMTALTQPRPDLTPETEHFEEEKSNPVWAFAQLRRLGVGLMTVGHANFVGLIRIPRPSAHLANATGELTRFVETSWSRGHIATTQCCHCRDRCHARGYLEGNGANGHGTSRILVTSQRWWTAS